VKKPVLQKTSTERVERGQGWTLGVKRCARFIKQRKGGGTKKKNTIARRGWLVERWVSVLSSVRYVVGLSGGRGTG